MQVKSEQEALVKELKSQLLRNGTEVSSDSKLGKLIDQTDNNLRDVSQRISKNSLSGMIGYWTNLKMARFTFAIEPIEKLKVSYTYSDLKAHQPVASLGGTGTDRGQLQELRAAYPFTKDVTSYVIGEKMHYGDFYQAGAGDGYCTRAELSVKF